MIWLIAAWRPISQKRYNLIALDNFDPQSGIPAYKNIPVVLEKVDVAS